MPVSDMLLNSVVLMQGVWNSPIALIPVALAAVYFGWRVVEFIPFTRRIIERREGGN